MKQFIPLIMLAAAGCTMPPVDGAVTTGAVSPTTRPATLDTTPPPPPPTNATTVDQFDTTTAEDRAEAVIVQASVSDAPLGVTIASLGPPAEPGIWLKTSLVTELTPGRVDYQGKSINLELRPSGKSAGAGSQISLAAMRLLEAPLTSLPEVTVFKR